MKPDADQLVFVTMTRSHAEEALAFLEEWDAATGATTAILRSLALAKAEGPLNVEDGRFRGKRLGDMSRDELMQVVETMGHIFDLERAKHERDLDLLLGRPGKPT